MTSLVLGINRCCELYSSHTAARYFGGRRIWLWLTYLICYTLFFAFFTKPPIWNPSMISWFFNPHYGYVDDTKLVVSKIKSL